MRLDRRKPAVGALQTIFVKLVSSGHLLVLKRCIDTCASGLKLTCIHKDTTRRVCVNGSQREYDARVSEFCER